MVPLTPGAEQAMQKKRMWRYTGVATGLQRNRLKIVILPVLEGFLGGPGLNGVQEAAGSNPVTRTTKAV